MLPSTTTYDAIAAQAFESAQPATSGECDVPDCPAFAMKRVDLFDQDFYFCTHHWSEHLDRLRILAAEEVAPTRALQTAGV
jgi:hypothetical protein